MMLGIVREMFVWGIVQYDLEGNILVDILWYEGGLASWRCHLRCTFPS